MSRFDEPFSLAYLKLWRFLFYFLFLNRNFPAHVLFVADLELENGQQNPTLKQSIKIVL